MTLHRDRFGALAYRWGEDVALRDTGREIQVVSGAADAARAGLLIGAEKFAALTLIGPSLIGPPLIGPLALIGAGVVAAGRCVSGSGVRG